MIKLINPKNNSWFIAIDCSAYFPLRNATYNDLWIFAIKVKQKKTMLMSSKLLISKFDNNEILKDDFKSIKKQIEEKQIRIKTAIKIEVR